jgi:hypothetical protein
VTADDDLTVAATGFADDLTNLTQGVLGEASPAFSAVVTGNKFRVAPFAAGDRIHRIAVSIDQQKLLSLYVQYFCLWDGPKRFLAVDQADIHVYFEGGTDPLIRYEYVRSWKEPPGAHIHVHAHRDEMAYLLRLSERKKGQPAQKLRKGKLPRLAEMHFPVGGHRFRPSLEDVLMQLEREFAIDTAEGWQEVIRSHLVKWRTIQLKAAVRDAHEDAADALRELGYEVTRPSPLADQDPGRLYWP